MFDPKTDKFPYPEYTDKHYLIVKKDDGTVFDENYPYIDKSFGFKFKQFWVRLLLICIVFPMTYIRLGLRIIGRKNLKEHKNELKNGAVSVCNHVHMWDYLAIMKAIRPKWSNILSWDKNVSGESGPLVRMVGGIPIPVNNPKATIAYMSSIQKLLCEDKGWLHIYPEGAMWEYYQPIRPFKHGALHFACKYNKPVVPLGFSYRKPGWIRRVIFKQIACFDLHVGEPIYPDMELALVDREMDLTKRCHERVCQLVGIDPDKNLYPPIFDNTKRVDYYTSTYGVGYKGSK